MLTHPNIDRSYPAERLQGDAFGQATWEGRPTGPPRFLPGDLVCNRRSDKGHGASYLYRVLHVAWSSVEGGGWQTRCAGASAPESSFVEADGADLPIFESPERVQVEALPAGYHRRRATYVLASFKIAKESGDARSFKAYKAAHGDELRAMFDAGTVPRAQRP